MFDVTAPCPSWPPQSYTDASGVQITSGPVTLTEKQLPEWHKLLQLAKGRSVNDKYKLTDEDILLRYYIARGFDAEKAWESLLTSEQWRKDGDMDNVQAWAVKTMAPDVVYLTHSGFQGFYGFDCEGYPIFWERPNQKGLNEFIKQYGSDTCLRYHHACMERVRELPKYLHTDRVSWVIDMKDCGGSALFGDTGALLKLQSKIDQEHYPELMRKMFIINAPFGFSGSFTVVKHFLDARVQQKISIDGKRRPGDSLSKWVTEDNIPVEFGGTAVVDWDKCRVRPTTDTQPFTDERFLSRIYELNPSLRPAPQAADAGEGDAPDAEGQNPLAPEGHQEGSPGHGGVRRRSSTHRRDGDHDTVLTMDMITCMSHADDDMSSVASSPPRTPTDSPREVLPSSPTPLRADSAECRAGAAQHPHAHEGKGKCGCCLVM